MTGDCAWEASFCKLGEFFGPIQGQLPFKNPLVGPFFNRLRTATYSTSPKDLLPAAWSQPGAIWRRMLLTQPAVEGKAICKRRIPDSPERINVEMETSNVRLGGIFKWTEKWYNVPSEALYLKSTGFELDMPRLYPERTPLLRALE